MKRTLIILIVGLLSVGCETPKQKALMLTPEEQKALRDSVVGEYEYKSVDGFTRKLVFLENGVYEWYVNGRKQTKRKWSIVDGETHVKFGSGRFEVWRINPDESITGVAIIRGGKRTDLTKEHQLTFKKIN